MGYKTSKSEQSASIHSKTYIQQSSVSQNTAVSISAKRVCYCVVKTCHPPGAHCHLQQE